MARIFSMCLALSSIAWQYQETTGQQVLPLGIFSFFGQTARQSPAPTLLTAAPSSSAQADTPALTRKLVDVGSPADVTFEMSCAGSTSRAALSCHCAGIGHRCADSASICNANGKCICDPSLSYQDGSKCVRYPTTTATTTTTCPSAITCPSTTSCPVCSATTPACPTTPTCPTVPTTTSSTTTTTMTTTTTTPLDTRCATSGILSGGGKCGGCVQLTLATTTTLQLDAGSTSMGFCLYEIVGPPGSALTLTRTSNTLVSGQAHIIINGNAYSSSTGIPYPAVPPTISLPASSAGVLLIGNPNLGSVIFTVSAAPATV
ncbi:integumentary mucin C.1-like isoform X2 [Paramacrobiotus metropolitanus]|uniref:integumentary mucin C.1-like isoform X2 n=1 Tax=Paramacrobiotus metropolitanus TaxID=2943436 RepID=UPI002445CA9C|nr:integumentary mucin C.1-like isoform X2 [Paramacrobiotus metropolitanus]